MVAQFDDFPEHVRRIGCILAEYGELEYLIGTCVGFVIKDRIAGLKTIFRMRGQSARMEVADAILRPGFDKMKLKDAYETALGAARYSRKLWNQFAHAHWMGYEKEGLYFTDMDDAAQTANNEELWYTMHHIDVPLLDRQLRYVRYSVLWFAHLHHECRRLAGEFSSHDWPAPKIIEPPPLHNPIAEHPLPRTEKDAEPAPEEPLPEDR